MSKPSSLWLSLGAVALLGCTTHTTPAIADANASPLIGAPRWILECGTEAQWMKRSRPAAPRRSTNSARR